MGTIFLVVSEARTGSEIPTSLAVFDILSLWSYDIIFFSIDSPVVSYYSYLPTGTIGGKVFCENTGNT